MPIYAYKCDACGFAKDALQKMSDSPLTDCPQCGAAAFKKQVTAAGFQLKGSGWYATDFKGGSTPAPATGVAPSNATDTKPAESSAPKADTAASTPPAASGS